MRHVAANGGAGGHIGAERRESLFAGAVIDEVELAPRELVAVAAGVLAPSDDDAIEIPGARQRIEEHAADEAHDRSHRAECEGEGCDSRECERLLTRQASERVAEVGSELIASKTQGQAGNFERRCEPETNHSHAFGLSALLGKHRGHLIGELLPEGSREDEEQRSIRAVIHEVRPRARSFAPRAACTSFSRRAASASATSRPKAVSL